jgi:hypothetical protein
MMKVCMIFDWDLGQYVGKGLTTTRQPKIWFSKGAAKSALSCQAPWSSGMTDNIAHFKRYEIRELDLDDSTYKVIQYSGPKGSE